MGVLYEVVKSADELKAKQSYEFTYGKGTWDKLDKEVKSTYKRYGTKGINIMKGIKNWKTVEKNCANE